MGERPERVGLWFIGGRGSVAVTSTVGALALRAGLAGDIGLVSARPEVARAGLPDLSMLVIGGHDVTATPLVKRAEALAAGGVLPADTMRLLHEEIERVDGRLRPVPSGPQGEVVSAMRRDLVDFREAHSLARVVVVDVSSTEGPVSPSQLESGPLADLAQLEASLAAGESPLPSSAVGVAAAYLAGCPVVAFTPSPGVRLPALEQLAAREGLPWAGADGKTGETLVKTALAPMFATRSLRVRSWASYNLLGGSDGERLADPVAAASKTATKGAGVEAILGHPVNGPIHIDFAPDLGEWKTAMDHVSFEGFLGVRMSLQFTWSGCDSALAAPLVLDLARLLARAHAVGERGPVPALGFFFKDPAGSEEHDLGRQWLALVDWCAKIASR